MQEDSAGMSIAGSMVTLKAFYSSQLSVRIRLSMCITYTSNNLEQEVSVIVHTHTIKLIASYLVYMLRWILSRLDYADETCQI